MLRGLEAKFALGSQLAAKLLETGEKRLAEHTWSECLCGAGATALGQRA